MADQLFTNNCPYNNRTEEIVQRRTGIRNNLLLLSRLIKKSA
jgi:hypothetical protein